MAAPSQKIPLNIEKTAKEILGESSSLSRDLAETTRNLRAGRRDVRFMGGFLNLLTGGANVGNIRNVGGVAELAANRLASAGHLKQAVAMQGLAGFAKFAASAIGTTTAIVGTAYAGFELGTGLYNLAVGDPQQMKDTAASRDAFQAGVMKSKSLTLEQKTALMNSAGKFEERSAFSKYNPIGLAAEAVDRSRGTSGYGPVFVENPKRDIIKFMAEHRLNQFDETKAELKARSDKDRWTTMYETIKFWGNEKAENERVLKAMTEIQEEKEDFTKYRKDALNNSAVGLRTRSLENFRFLQLRKAEESKWSGVKDWSA